MSLTSNSERVAIVGTAQTWQKTPWTDPGLKIWSLNDAYRMKGFVRADAWYDLHPLNKFYHPENGMVYAHQVPPGHYCRPVDHLTWLAGQSIPVWLHPDYAEQHPEAASWPMARAFPKDAIEAHFGGTGAYFTSSPAWMIGQALMEGVKELHIYGIHLATEHEYIEQRPNFEMLCGALLGRGKRTVSVHDGMRRYESADGLLVIPEAAPILQSSFQYAFEPRPASYTETHKWELHKIDLKRGRLIEALKRKPAWLPWIAVPDGRMFTKTAQEELFRLDALAADTHEILGRMHAEAQIHG